MNKIIFFTFALILVACSPQVTATPEVTVTLTPPPTETPTPTSTPEPAYYEDAQIFLGEGFTVTSDGKVIDVATNAEIEGFKIVLSNEQTMIDRKSTTQPASTWALQRIYEFEGKTDFTVNMTKYDIKVENGTIDMFGWIYENGAFTRQKVEFVAPNNGTVKIDGYSPEEVQYMIMTNSSTDPKNRVNSPEALRQMAIEYIPKVVNGQVGYIITYMGMAEKTDRNFKRYGNNFIPNINSDGTWSSVETAEFMVYPEFEDRNKALVVWVGEDNKPVIVVLEGKWLDLPKYFNKYWENHDIEDPFNP